MEQNRQVLTSLYRQISVGEIIEKVKNSGVIWNQPNKSQFTATVTANDNSIWDLSLSRMPVSDLIVLDFKRNGRFFFSINSDQDSKIKQLFIDAETDENWERDKKIIRTVRNKKGRGIQVYDVISKARVKINGFVIISQATAVGDGVAVLAGSSSLLFSYLINPVTGCQLSGSATVDFSPIIVGGVVSAGSATVGESLIIAPTGGAVLGNSATLNYVYTQTVSGGIIGGGEALTGSPSNITMSGGVITGGIATFTSPNNIIPTGGVVVGGDSLVAETNNDEEALPPEP